MRVKGDQRYIDAMLANTERFGTFTVELTASGECCISASLASDTPFYHALPKTGSLWGFDANVENLLTGSDGERIKNPAYYCALEQKLIKQQRKLSRRLEAAKKRCPNGMKLRQYLETCKNYQAQRRKVAALHEHVKRQRADYLHQVTKRAVKNHDLIAAENLSVKSLFKNHCLAKAISDVSWGELFRQLRYKASLYRKTFIQVSPHYTTQTCSDCGYVMQGEEKLTLSDREWICPNCGVLHDRDHNSAINILNRAMSQSAFA